MGKLDRCRSSIASAARDFAVIDKQMKYRHWKFIKSTPFKYLLLAMHNGNLKLNSAKFCKEGLEKLIQMYDPAGNTFHLGNLYRKVRENDIALILGLPMEPNLQMPQRVSPTVFEKYFSGKSVVKKQDIISCLDSLVKEEAEDKVRDFVVLLVLLLGISFLFQSSAGTISKAKIDLVDQELYSNIWPSTICMALRESIQGVQTFSNLGGPAILLLYWFAEQVNLIRRIAKLQHHRPRAVRWDLGKVIKKLRSVDLATLTPLHFSGYNPGEQQKVEEDLSFIGEKELKFLKGGNIYTEDDNDPDNVEFNMVLETLKAEEVEEEENEDDKKVERGKEEKKQKKEKQVGNKKKEAGTSLNLLDNQEKNNEVVEKENEKKKRNRRVRFKLTTTGSDGKENEKQERKKKVHFMLTTIDVEGKENVKTVGTEEEDEEARGE